MIMTLNLLVWTDRYNIIWCCMHAAQILIEQKSSQTSTADSSSYNYNRFDVL
jgi:hypothetical protein